MIPISKHQAWLRFSVVLGAFLLLGICISLVVFSYRPPANKTPSPAPPPSVIAPPNIIVIYTDDQRADTLWAMPEVQKYLVADGVTFTNAFITTPLCCPSRASFLSGGFYPAETGVVTNAPPNGGAAGFKDDTSLAVALKRRGYATAMIGKYLNGFGALKPYVPPGWDLFVEPVGNDWSNFSVTMGSSTADRPGVSTTLRATTYLTDFLGDTALQFINQHDAEPFFIYLTPRAPHEPAIPAPADRQLFSDYVYTSPATRETDLSDKPLWVQESNNDFDEDNETGATITSVEFQRDQLRSLQAVDRLVAALVSDLKTRGRLDNTIIILAGDNGFMWGEHGLFAKDKPYEPSIKVPLVIRWPGVEAATRSELVAVNLDVPATILAWAQVKQATDGLNLASLIENPDVPWREGLPLQGWNNNPSSSLVPQWVSWRTDRYKYIRYQTGEQEFYDLLTDPEELTSQHAKPEFADAISRFEDLMNEFTGLYALFNSQPPPLPVNKPFSLSLEAAGGRPPYHWQVVATQPLLAPAEQARYGCLKRLPQGLSLQADGTISGTPTKKEWCAVVVEVRDSGRSRATGDAHRYQFTIKLKVQ